MTVTGIFDVPTRDAWLAAARSRELPDTLDGVFGWSTVLVNRRTLDVLRREAGVERWSSHGSWYVDRERSGMFVREAQELLTALGEV